MTADRTSSSRARWIIWGSFALALLVAPWLFSSNLGVTMLCQIGIAIIACLSYNILLGQGGMLSFGHCKKIVNLDRDCRDVVAASIVL